MPPPPAPVDFNQLLRQRLETPQARLQGFEPITVPVDPMSVEAFANRLNPSTAPKPFQLDPLYTPWAQTNAEAGAQGQPFGPVPDVSLQGGDPNQAGRISLGMGSSLRMGPSIDDVEDKMRASAKYLRGVGAIGRPDEGLSNEALTLMHKATGDEAAAKRAEAKIIAGQEDDLLSLSKTTEDFYKGEGKSEKTQYDITQDALQDVREKRAADEEYVRTHQRIDPYRTFQTNAGAGIFAVLGSALMASGAALKRDSSLDWTKQIDNMLDREAQAQIRLLDNKKWSVTEAGQNMKRIMDTSTSSFEARARFRMQHLAALTERAKAIGHATESAAVKQKAELFVAQAEKKMAEDQMNLAIRQQTLRSGENVAELQAKVAERGQTLGYLGGLQANASTRANALNQADLKYREPIEAARLALRQLYIGARSAAEEYWRILNDPKSTDSVKNEAAMRYTDASSKYYSGSTEAPGERAAAGRGWGPPLSYQDFRTKISGRHNAKDLQVLLEGLDRSYGSRDRFIDTRTLPPPVVPPAGASYSSPR
jgi:hypothetical protein